MTAHLIHKFYTPFKRTDCTVTQMQYDVQKISCLMLCWSLSGHQKKSNLLKCGRTSEDVLWCLEKNVQQKAAKRSHTPSCPHVGTESFLDLACSSIAPCSAVGAHVAFESTLSGGQESAWTLWPVYDYTALLWCTVCSDTVLWACERSLWVSQRPIASLLAVLPWPLHISNTE